MKDLKIKPSITWSGFQSVTNTQESFKIRVWKFLQEGTHNLSDYSEN